MAEILVRNVDGKVLSKLKSRAKQNGRSLQNELLQIFISLTESDDPTDEKIADRIKNDLRGRSFSDSAAMLRKDRRR